MPSKADGAAFIRWLVRRRILAARAGAPLPTGAEIERRLGRKQKEEKS